MRNEPENNNEDFGADNERLDTGGGEQENQPFEGKRGRGRKNKPATMRATEEEETNQPETGDEEPNDDDVYIVDDEQESEGMEGDEGEEEEEGEEGDYDEEEEEGEEEGEEEEDGGLKGQVERIAKKVMEYIKENGENVDRAELRKYAAVAVLAIYGLRRSSLLGSILVSAAVAIIAKHLFTEGKEKETA